MKIAIQGHLSRGHKVIQILESLGGKNCSNLYGRRIEQYYFINSNGDIDLHYQSNLFTYKLYTLEEFETQFPFKVGELCVYQSKYNGDIVVKVLGMSIQGNDIVYEIGPKDTGKTYSGIYRKRDTLKPYKKMKEERNVTLTLEKAKEWYKKGGELKEIALQAFTEKELNPLPKSWNEFCETHPIKKEESYITNRGEIFTYACSSTRLCPNVCPSEDSAIAHLAMIQLEQLRDCWRQGWKPKMHESVYTIKFAINGLDVYNYASREFLSFPTREMAKEFLECFRDLIEQAGDLI